MSECGEGVQLFVLCFVLEQRFHGARSKLCQTHTLATRKYVVGQKPGKLIRGFEPNDATSSINQSDKRTELQHAHYIQSCKSYKLNKMVKYEQYEH